jgi:hypothetical protein
MGVAPVTPRIPIGALAISLASCLLDVRGTGDGLGAEGASAPGVACEPGCVAKNQCWRAECTAEGTCDEWPVAAGTPCGFDDLCDGEGNCRLRAGDACSADVHCSTDRCIDGVCCKTSCDGLCERCGAEGNCIPIASGQDVDDECDDASCDGTGHCATGALIWAQRFGGGLTDAAKAVAVEPASGDLMIALEFQGAVTVGGETFNAQSGDGLVVRLDANGNFRWAKQIGGTGAAILTSLSFGTNGRIFVTGAFTFGVTVDSFSADAGATFDGLVLELDAQGNLLSPLVLGGAGQQVVLGVVLAPDGTRVVAGNFAESVDLDGTTKLTNGLGDVDGFLAAYTSNGALAWHLGLSGTGPQEVAAIGRGKGSRLWVAGRFGDSLTAGTTSIFSAGGFDGFVLALDASTVSWAESLGGAGDQGIAALAARNDGGLVVAGGFEGEITPQGPSSAGVDIFVARYASEGARELVEVFGSAGADAARGLSVDAADNVIMSGVIGGPVDFGGGALSATIAQAFVVKRTPSGEHLWSRSFGGTSFDEATAVATAPKGIALVGLFHSSDATIEGTQLPQQGNGDAFCVRLEP